MGRQRFRAVIFDFDGLMLDTETVEYQTWQEAFAKFDINLPIEVWGQAIGRGFSDAFDPFVYLEEQLGHTVDREAITAERSVRDRELLTGRPLLPGVETYIQDARAMGLRIAVASSSPNSWVSTHLSSFGLLEKFDAICTADDVERTKPYPDVFLAALTALGVQAEEAIVLEDSPNGVLAAKRAGIYVVAVPNEVTRHLAFDDPDHRMTALTELPLRDILTQASNNHHG